MELFNFLLAESESETKRTAIHATLAGILEGVALLIVSMTVVTPKSEGFNYLYFAVFIVTVLGYLYAKHRALTSSSALVEGIIRKIRLNTAEKILHSQFAAFERVDPSRLTAVLSKETRRLAEATHNVVTAWTSFVMLIVGFIVILFLSTFAFQVILLFACAGMVIYFRDHKQIVDKMIRAVGTEMDLHQKLSHLLKGFKELRLNTQKSKDLIENHYMRQASSSRRLFEEVWKGFAANILKTSSLFFLGLGSIVFLVPSDTLIGNLQTFQVLTVVIFVLGHMTALFQAVPQLSKAGVAIGQIRAVESDLDELEKEEARLSADELEQCPEFKEIKIEGLTYDYGQPGADKAFSLGPIDLTLSPGEIVFIVGGNDSGKTTFVRLLTSLYRPREGRIFLDGDEVTDAVLPSYRTLFSTVFTDFHLFGRLYGAASPTSREAEAMLGKLGIDMKTSLKNRRFSVTDLSAGQRRRLALACALFEKKPICLFDKVAADQDPEFRRFLYTELFPQLKKSGQTVLAITHDEKYFGHADRVIKLKDGKIE